MDVGHELESFLRSVSPRAFRIARLRLREDQDALDAVQEAMIKLARFYGDRPAEQWTPLFYAILRNCVRDQQRSRQSRNTLAAWFARLTSQSESEAALTSHIVASARQPPDELESSERLRRLGLAIGRLPPRQQEAFLLRNLEGLDVNETATAMGCSEGSVKTHYSRAVRALRAMLGEL